MYFMLCKSKKFHEQSRRHDILYRREEEELLQHGEASGETEKSGKGFNMMNLENFTPHFLLSLALLNPNPPRPLKRFYN